MDITAIAAAATAILSPYLAEGAKELTKTATGELLSWVKNKLKGKKEEKQLAEFEQNPTNTKLHGKLELVLENLMEENETLKNELLLLVEKAQKEGDTITISNSSKFIAGNKIQSGGDTNITIS